MDNAGLKEFGFKVMPEEIDIGIEGGETMHRKFFVAKAVKA